MARRSPSPGSPIRLAGGHRARHRACELLERRRAARPQFRRQPARHFGLLLLRRFLVSQRVHRAASFPGKSVWLNFDGINWKAEVTSTARSWAASKAASSAAATTSPSCCGRPEKRPRRAHYRNATPGSIKEKTFESTDKNGGALGADNPTYHATIGWDWIPTIRGRDIGIWSKVSSPPAGR